MRGSTRISQRLGGVEIVFLGEGVRDVVLRAAGGMLGIECSPSSTPGITVSNTRGADHRTRTGASGTAQRRCGNWCRRGGVDTGLDVQQQLGLPDNFLDAVLVGPVLQELLLAVAALEIL